MRRFVFKLEVLVVVIVAACLAALSASSRPPDRPQLELTAGPGDTLTLSNSKEGSAILSLGGMRPGDSVIDTVNLGNTGTLPGDLTLSTSNLVDTPGSGGGSLSGELNLRVRDITNAGSPATVFNGKIGAVAPVALGSLAAGASRVYEFRVSFPDAGPGAENAFQGSSMSIQFDWTAFNPEDVDTTPPNTTISSAPPALSNNQGPAFAFTASEAGSTFECSLDSGAWASCSTPKSYSGLADGPHTFGVRATDSDGDTDATPASHAWTIDATDPSKPKKFSGKKKGGRLVLKWKAASDNTAVGAHLVYANGNLVKTLGASARSVNLGKYRTSDKRSFQVAARDTAGNVGAKTGALVIVPELKNLALAAATAQLTARGLQAGTLTYSYSSAVAAGRVIRAGRSGVVAKGVSVDLRVSRGVTPRSPAPTPPPAPPAYTPPPPTSGYTPTDPSAGFPTAPDPTSAPTDPPDAEGSPDPSVVVPESFSPAGEDTSPLRRLAGVALLGGAFLTAGAVAWGARRARIKSMPSSSVVEPLVFWDARFARTISSSVRRLLSR